jgi:hypothetical protein
VIGGEDLVLDGPTSPDDWTVVFYEINQRWPRAIFEKVGEDEYLAWKDQSAFRREFADDETPHGFIHILMGPQCLTLVVDADESTECSRLGRAVLEVMRGLKG